MSLTALIIFVLESHKYLTVLGDLSKTFDSYFIQVHFNFLFAVPLDVFRYQSLQLQPIMNLF